MWRTERKVGFYSDADGWTDLWYDTMYPSFADDRVLLYTAGSFGGDDRYCIQYDIFSGFLAGLSETVELPVDFNEKLFHRLVDYVTVYHDGRVVFTFRNGVEVSTEI